MAHTYKLHYFNVTALAEPARFLFAYGGIEYEDFRFELEEFYKYRDTMPFGQAPALEIDGKMINQSVAIARYAAKLAKLTGKDDLHDLEMDSMVDNINDVRIKIIQYWYEPNEEYKQYLHGPLKSLHMPFLLGKLNEIAEKNHGYFIRGELSWVDLFFTALLNYFDHMLQCNSIENYPGLQKVRDNVLKIPAIKEWVAKRPKGKC